MLKKPFFSIILPTFNQSTFLKKCINSILTQTYENWELIIIDNNSTDDTIKIINEFNDERIKVLKIRNSGILAKSRNLGIKKSISQWICFLDTDDTWYPQKLSEVKTYIHNTNGDLFYHDLVFENKKICYLIKKKIRDKSKTLDKPILKHFAHQGNGVGNSSVVIKKKLLQSLKFISIKKDKYSWEDFDTWLRASLKTNNFIRIPKVLGSIWVGTDNISNLDRQITNSINIKKYYKKIFYKYLSKENKKKNLWWLEYPSILKEFRNKNIVSCSNKIKNITTPPLKIFLILKYIKLNLLITTIYRVIKRFVTVVIIFRNTKVNFSHLLIKNYRIIKNKNNLKKIKFNNFKMPKKYIDRVNAYNHFHYIFKKNNLISYGWSSNNKIFLLSETNKSIVNKNNIILYDFNTIMNYRRKGYYKLLLRLILKTFKYKDCYIYSTLMNIKSILGIVKSGFEFNRISTVYKKKINLF